jgi:hypothetical protein
VNLPAQFSEDWSTLMWTVLTVVFYHTERQRASGEATHGITRHAMVQELDKRQKDKGPKALQALVETHVIVIHYDDMGQKHYGFNWYELERQAHRDDVACILKRLGYELAS